MFDDEVSQASFTLSKFCIVSAEFVESLICARRKVEPGFLSEEELRSWKLENINAEPVEAWEHMHQAADAMATLNRELLSRPVPRLIFEITSLAEAAALDLNSTLRSAAAMLQRGEMVEWEQIINWSKLRAIRRDLDRLLDSDKSQSGGGSVVENVPSSFVFRRRRRDWILCFGSSGEQPFTHRDGFVYLHHILRHPNAEHSPVELYALKTSSAARNGNHVVGIAEASMNGFSIDNSTAGHPEGADSDAWRQYYGKLRELEGEIEDARGDNDEARVAFWEAQKEQLREELDRTPRRLGRGRLKSDRDKVRPAVQSAIKEIRSVLPDLADHLDDCLKIETFRYAPSTPLEWQT